MLDAVNDADFTSQLFQQDVKQSEKTRICLFE